MDYEPTLGTITGLVYDESMEKHQGPVNHPERPERTRGIWQKLTEERLVPLCRVCRCREVTRQEATTVHSDALWDAIGATANGTPYTTDRSSGTYTCVDSAQCARLAAGSLVDLALAAWQGVITNGFANIRPPGHHCEPSEALGFCLLNNIALAVKAVRAAGAQRVLIVDWDVHHGNGTQLAFEDDPSVLFLSVHAHLGGKFFPYSGAMTEVGTGAGRGYTVNVPWPKFGQGDADYIHVFEHLLLPIAKEFQPDMVMVSCGFDATEGDPIGKMHVTPEGYAHLLSMLMPLADGKIVLALEGGYNVSAISYCAEAVVRTLLGQRVDPPEGSAPKDTTLELVDAVRSVQQEFWATCRTLMPQDTEGGAVG